MVLNSWDDFEPCCQFIKNKIEFTHLFIRCFIFKQESLPFELIDTAIEASKKIGKKLWIETPFLSKSVSIHSVDRDRINIFELKQLSSERQQYFDNIRKRIDDIDRIVVSWSFCYESGGYNRWARHQSYKNILNHPIKRSIEPTLKEFEEMLKFVKDFQEAGKLAFSAIDVPFEREAHYYQGRLNEAPLLNWLKKHNVINLINRGTWVLDKDMEEHNKNYNVTLHARSPILVYADQYDSGTYPYKYYQDYLKAGVEFWSGIGYNTGILRGNHKNLVEAGYAGSIMHFEEINVTAWNTINSQPKS
jgi:hypothetical protein|tara:strand:- start:1233 stop:2144 length:912 start_codon:yes stop_codon:yes gene_type:complete